MILAYKQLLKQIFRNKIFVVLLALLTLLTSLSFFFVKFSIDGNIGRIAEITAGGGDIPRYQTAQSSNTILAYSFFLSMNLLTAFVFFIFFYRFFRSCRKQIGSLKALGFQDSGLRGFFVLFTAVLSLLGGLAGLCGAYPMSEVLIRANRETYGVSGLVRTLSVSSILIGLLGQTAVFTLTAFLCYLFIKGREPGRLIAGNLGNATHSSALRGANAVIGMLPIKNKFPLRIALRKPLAILLILIGVMSFSTCIIIGRSLNISSQMVFDSQTIGHHYEYDLRYPSFLDGDSETEKGLRYLSGSGKIYFRDQELPYSILGFYGQSELFGLLDAKGHPVALPKSGGAVIGPGLADTYGLRAGDLVTVTAEDSESMTLLVEAVAYNAKSGSIYVNPAELTASLGIASGSYNGRYSDKAPISATQAQITTRSQRMALLERDAVSNNISGVINQLTGVLVGCILFFLALYVNFQDNTRDMLILYMMGYPVKAIRKMLIDVYRPLVWLCFLITLYPSILMVKSIQRGLSVSTGDYMPFGTSLWVILIAFAALTLLYQLVQWVFGGAIARVVRKENIAEHTGGE